MQKFPSGEWVAIAMEHACCTGAGFNAVVVYDSHGKIRTNTERCFCGYEELGSFVSKIHASTLAEFDAQFIPLRERY